MKNIRAFESFANEASSDGDRHKYYVKAFKNKADYEDKNSALFTYSDKSTTMYWDEAVKVQDGYLENGAYCAVIYAVKDNREVSVGFQRD